MYITKPSTSSQHSRSARHQPPSQPSRRRIFGLVNAKPCHIHSHQENRYRVSHFQIQNQPRQILGQFLVSTFLKIHNILQGDGLCLFWEKWENRARIPRIFELLELGVVSSYVGPRSWKLRDFCPRGKVFGACVCDTGGVWCTWRLSRVGRESRQFWSSLAVCWLNICETYKTPT